MMFKSKKNNAIVAKDSNGNKNHQGGKRLFLVNFLFIILLSLSATSLMVLYIDRLPSNVYVGGIATQDIRADQNYEIVDVDATNKLKEEATLSTLPVYDYDMRMVDNRIVKIGETFSKAREILYKGESNQADDKNKKPVRLSDEDEERLSQMFLFQLGLVLDDSSYKSIRKDGFSEELEKALSSIVEHVQKKRVIQDTSELELISNKAIVLRILDGQTSTEEQVITKFDHIIGLQIAQKMFDAKDVSSIQKKMNLEFINQDKVKLAIKLYPEFIQTNMTINRVETETRRERAQMNVQSIIYKLQKGQIIIRSGDRYEPRHLTVLQGIREARLQTNVVLRFLGVFLLVCSCLFIIYQFAYLHIKRFHPSRKDINFLGLLLVLFLAGLRLGSFMGSSLQDAMPFPVDITTFYYAIPIAAGAMMIRYILNAETAFVFSVIISLLAGLFLEHSYEMTAYYFLSSLLAASVIGHVEKRSSVLRRGLYVGLVNLFLVLCLSLIGKISTSAIVDVQTMITNCLFAFLGGVLSALTLLAISPIMEALFNYTTNIQLLELANMNHPLLREMIVRAPGTYHHSQLVGILAEAGTRAINGNALLARVASYYHDIGKMKKPQYFIENQKGENPHDNLVASMSALIVEAHVKDGIEMAKEYKLPQVISAFIPEHQGTKQIGFFYHKALKLAEKDGSKVDERHYRYKGPKPQSRESGAVMLSDTVEAAVRSMSDKSPQKIQALVEKLVNSHFVDGQLDECDLTLRDLHVIVDAFVKILIGIYHQRVEYPQINKVSPLASTSSGKDERANNHSQPSSEASNISPLFKEKN